MSKFTILGAAAVSILVIAALRAGNLPPEPDVGSASVGSQSIARANASEAERSGSFLYGRIITIDGESYEGRLRWGGDEEAFWGNYFNGDKDENPWAAHAPSEQLTEARYRIELFGFEILLGERQIDLSRPFMARFGDIARIEARDIGVRASLERGIEFDPEVRVTLKSGAVFVLDRFAAGDFDDGVRVWDARRGVVDLGPPIASASEVLERLPDARRIRSIVLLPGSGIEQVPDRLHGTVRTRHGEFTGFLQWDRQEALGRDELVGRGPDGVLRLRFDGISSIARHPANGSLVTLLDGRDVMLSGTRKVGPGNLGVYVDDQRYGRVLVSWEAFERVDFSPGGSGPAYGDFPPGRPLMGRVTTWDGYQITGRLVYDLDESETTETLDAPIQGVHYTIPFGRVASIVLPGPNKRPPARARVTLHSGEQLELERTGDLSESNSGMLIFVDGRERPAYVEWTDVQEIAFERPPEMYPTLDGS